MDKLLKSIIILCILLISVSFVYYFVIFLPQKERDQLNMQKQVQMEKDKQAQETKAATTQKAEALQFCLDNADTSYSQDWNNECESEGKLSDECIKLIHETSLHYAKENNFSGNNISKGVLEYDKKVDACSCRLPHENADSIEKRRTVAKDECFKQYPQK